MSAYIPCWNTVSGSKRALANRTPPLETFSAFNESPKSATFQAQPSSPLLRLPGELRNRILELCIKDATFCPRCRRFHEMRADVSRNMLIKGIGTFPLLFTSKQLHDELVSLVYSKLETISINGYFLMFQRSAATYLPAWPYHQHVQDFARSVRVQISFWQFPGDGVGSWCYLTRDHQSVNFREDPFESNSSVVQRLASYLHSFSSLSELEIAIEGRWDPTKEDQMHGLDQLLPLYDLHVQKTTVSFEMLGGFKSKRSPMPLQDDARFKKLTLDWMQAWKDCLAGNGRKVPNIETGITEADHVCISSCETTFPVRVDKRQGVF